MGFECGRVPKCWQHFPFEPRETVLGKRTVLRGSLPIPYSNSSNCTYET